MTRKRSTKQKTKVLKGKGDYDVIEPSTKVKTNKIEALDTRVSRLESRVPKQASSKIGQMSGLAGRLLGSTVGNGDLGESAGTALARMFGHGDYTLKGNSLMADASGSRVPKFDSNGKRGVRIREREYIGDVFSGDLISGSTAFQNTSYPLNPGSFQTFPWLSTIASQFEEYEMHGLVFEFVSTSSEYNGTTQALGTIILATDYDPNDSDYSSKLEMENSDYAMSCKASQNMAHGIECEPSERNSRVMFVRNGPVPSSELKFYDLGKFQLATLGMSAAGVNLGELWVSYDVTFYKKQIIARFLGEFILEFAFTTTVNSRVSPLGTSRSKFGNFDCQVSSNTITFPRSIPVGTFLLTYWMEAPSTSPDLVPTFPETTLNCTSRGVNNWLNPSSGFLYNNLVVAGSSFSLSFRQAAVQNIIDITAPGASIIFANLSIPGTDPISISVNFTFTQIRKTLVAIS